MLMRKWVAAAAVLAVAVGAWFVGCDPLGHRRGGGRAAPSHHFTGYYSPEPGSTVGTGMIISVVFDHPVTDRDAVARAVTATARPAVPVVGHWFGSRRLDLRPQRYWAPGTVVDLRLRLRGVRGAPGWYGRQHKDVVFRIGRQQNSVVDARRHTLTVFRDGRELRVLPVSAGEKGHETYDGVMVISQKFRVTRMNGSTVGFGGEYDIAHVPHAMRLTDSGTFVHGNYWSNPWVFGAANTSHGCIGLPDTKDGTGHSPAAWFFAQSIVGDVVSVVGSHQAVVTPDNGLGGWNMAWSRWTAG